MLKKQDTGKDTGDNEGSIRMDATFTEIYELILHNKSMVKSELEILLQLVRKKQMKTMSQGFPEPAEKFAEPPGPEEAE